MYWEGKQSSRVDFFSLSAAVAACQLICVDCGTLHLSLSPKGPPALLFALRLCAFSLSSEFVSRSRATIASDWR